MAKIDKINVQGTDYDIDVPVGTGTAGQVLTVNNTGDGTEWKTPQSGGTQLYKHQINLHGSQGGDLCDIEIINSLNTAMNLSAVADYLYSKGFNSISNRLLGNTHTTQIQLTGFKSREYDSRCWVYAPSQNTISLSIMFRQLTTQTINDATVYVRGDNTTTNYDTMNISSAADTVTPL